jgi:DUF4097 and DUF4098 domain-containing protein YvlB
MKKTVLLILALTIGGRAAAADIDETRAADPDGQVTVSIISGSIEVSGWDRDEVRVTGTYEDDVEEFIFERDGGEVNIRIETPDRSFGNMDVSAYLVIQVPENSELDIGTVSADIDVAGVRGEQQLQSVSGNVSAEAYDGNIEAGTVSGKVDVESAVDESDGEWGLSSVSGDVRATGLSGDLRAEVVSGEIEINGGSYSRVRAESVNGDIALSGGLVGDGRIDMESVNGGIDVVFTGPLSASFEIETFNGRIRNCFGPEPERTSKYAPGLELDFTEGDGDGRVSVSTLNGSIEVCKE